ncbi:MAG: hypothetical protein ACYSTS_19425 [Planctomycetota bacterium]|jgi:hypothetical protein
MLGDFDGYRVKIRRDICGNLEFYFIFRDYRSRKISVVKPVNLIFEEVEEGVSIEPTFRINRESIEDSDNLLENLAEDLSKHGIRTNREGVTQGKLEATSYHLEDLRLLLKLKK